MRRVVFDTNVFVRSLINPYGLWGRLVFAHASAYQLVVSQPIVQEILEVLQRPELTRKYRSLSTHDLQVVADLMSRADTVDLDDIPAIARDPNDDKFLATAVRGRAEYLVSEDEDLLVLGQYQSVRIVTAREFLTLLEEEGAE